LKHFIGSSFSDALLISSMLVKRRPFKVFFIFRNKKKSHGARRRKQQATTKFSRFGMNFAATRVMPKTCIPTTTKLKNSWSFFNTPHKWCCWGEKNEASYTRIIIPKQKIFKALPDPKIKEFKPKLTHGII
jgi:hypothetical protein